MFVFVLRLYCVSCHLTPVPFFFFLNMFCFKKFSFRKFCCSATVNNNCVKVLCFGLLHIGHQHSITVVALVALCGQQISWTLFKFPFFSNLTQVSIISIEICLSVVPHHELHRSVVYLHLFEINTCVLFSGCLEDERDSSRAVLGRQPSYAK